MPKTVRRSGSYAATNRRFPLAPVVGAADGELHLVRPALLHEVAEGPVEQGAVLGQGELLDVGQRTLVAEQAVEGLGAARGVDGPGLEVELPVPEPGDLLGPPEPALALKKGLLGPATGLDRPGGGHDPVHAGRPEEVGGNGLDRDPSSVAVPDPEPGRRARAGAGKDLREGFANEIAVVGVNELERALADHRARCGTRGCAGPSQSRR